MFWYCSPLGSLPSDANPNPPRLRWMWIPFFQGATISPVVDRRALRWEKQQGSTWKNNNKKQNGRCFFFLAATRSLGLWVYSVGFYGSIFYTGKLQRFWTFEFGIPYDYGDSRANKSKRPHILYTVGAKTYQPP